MIILRISCSSRHGWLALARHVVGTTAGGYLLLMAVVIAYYYGIARVAGAFLKSAFTGNAMLIAIALPLWGAASWLTEWRRQRNSDEMADPLARAGLESDGFDRLVHFELADLHFVQPDPARKTTSIS